MVTRLDRLARSTRDLLNTLALRRRDVGEPMRDIARTYNVSHSTISRLGAL